jgi:hypothetical protein
VLGNSLALDSPDESVDMLGLSGLGEDDLYSLEGARAAAQAGRQALDADLCLAVWMPLPMPEDPKERKPLYIALDLGRGEVISRSSQYGGARVRARGWLVNRALDMVRHALI